MQLGNKLKREDKKYLKKWNELRTNDEKDE